MLLDGVHIGHGVTQHVVSCARSAALQFLQMRSIVTGVARSVVCMSVCLCVMGTLVSPAKMDKPTEMLFGSDSRGHKRLFMR